MATAVGCSLSHTFPPVVDCRSWPMKQKKPSSNTTFPSGVLSRLQERPLIDLPSRAMAFRHVTCPRMFVNAVFNTREGSSPEQTQARMIQEASSSHYNLTGSVSVNLKGNANGKQQHWLTESKELMSSVKTEANQTVQSAFKTDQIPARTHNTQDSHSLL